VFAHNGIHVGDTFDVVFGSSIIPAAVGFDSEGIPFRGAI
jgi:hypothetical protein